MKIQHAKLQVKHIPDLVMLDLITAATFMPRVEISQSQIRYDKRSYATTFDLYQLWPDVPPKLILAKLRNLVKKGIIDGCACGCRGEFTIITKEES